MNHFCEHRVPVSAQIQKRRKKTPDFLNGHFCLEKEKQKTTGEKMELKAATTGVNY